MITPEIQNHKMAQYNQSVDLPKNITKNQKAYIYT